MHPFLTTQKMIIIMSTITLVQMMGILPTKGTCRNCKDSLGINFKSNKSKNMNWWSSHCASKTYNRQNTVLENIILVLRGFSPWCTVSLEEKPLTDHYKLRVSWFQLSIMSHKNTITTKIPWPLKVPWPLEITWLLSQRAIVFFSSPLGCQLHVPHVIQSIS